MSSRRISINSSNMIIPEGDMRSAKFYKRLSQHAGTANVTPQNRRERDQREQERWEEFQEKKAWRAARLQNIKRQWEDHREQMNGKSKESKRPSLLTDPSSWWLDDEEETSSGGWFDSMCGCCV